MSDYLDWEKEAIEKSGSFLEMKQDYVELPSKFDIHEYRIMETFCRSLSNGDTRETICRGIKGSDAFQRFREILIRFGIEDDWYR